MILTRIKNEIGATAIEYGLIASLVAVVAVSGMSAVGVNLSNTYCTISKHLGGSGTCSGASTGSGSSGTGGNGSTGGRSTSTGSVNSTNSIADGANINQIMEGLKEELDLNKLPSSMGGYDYAETLLNYQSALGDDIVHNISTALSNINKTDPITNVFGVYDKSNNNNPITDYDHVNDALQKGGGNITYGNKNFTSTPDMMQITTASGKVYSVSNFGSVTENTRK